MSKKIKKTSAGKNLKDVKLDISKSLDVKQEKINKLKELMPEIFTESDRIDTDKLKKTLGEFVNDENERYVLNWAGKSESFKVLQTQTTATLAPDKDESVNFDTTENIFIEGENLEVLKILQKSYHGKIKMIYIDPPYNTGNDSFVYPDKFEESKKDYLKRIGEKDEEGFLLKEELFRKNSKENGQYHSNWLSMIYPRLFLAKNLLRDDGVIFVSIDDNEVHNLRMVMNEIFGEENFISEIVWKGKGGGADNKYLMQTFEHIHLFSKTKDNFYIGEEVKTDEIFPKLDIIKKRRYKTQLARKWGSNSRRVDRPNLYYSIKSPDGNNIFPKLPNNEDGCWRWSSKKMNIEIKEGNIEFINKDGDWTVYEKIYEPLENEFNYKIFSNLLDTVGSTATGTKELLEIFEEKLFNFPKPSALLKRLIKISNCNSDDIVLDFFAGSGTTAQAVLELNKKDNGNRKFILVQLPEITEKESEANKAGYKTIADISKERIRRVIKKLESEKENEQLELDKENDTPLDLGFKVFKLKNSNFKLWRGDEIGNAEDLTKQLDAFDDPVKKGTEDENIVYELMLKMGLDLNLKVEGMVVSLDNDKLKSGKNKSKEMFGNYTYFRIDDGRILIFTEAEGNTANFINHILENDKPEKVICLDRIFECDDESKTNLVLQMRDAGVEFKTV